MKINNLYTAYLHSLGSLLLVVVLNIISDEHAEYIKMIAVRRGILLST